jgi:hypothetical protein
VIKHAGRCGDSSHAANMRKLILLCMAGIGCAPVPVVTLRVDPAAAGRVEATQRQGAYAAVDAAKKQMDMAMVEVKKAENEKAGPAVEGKERTRELNAVLKAAEERRTALVAWRQAQVEVARWQVAAADAQLELITAEAVARTGADVDPARFRGQAGNMQSGRIEASKKVAKARAQLDQKERALSEAKDRYAATLKPQPTSQLTSAQAR